MIKLNTEYFSNPYYFLIVENAETISLYYSIGLTLSESRISEEKIDFDKKNAEAVKKGVFNILKGKKLKNKEQIKKYFKSIENVEGELDELVDADGTLLNSSIPIYDKGLASKKTTDQIIPATRDVINPVTRGYRKYYGENAEKSKKVVQEIDYSEAFGYEETKEMSGAETYEYLVKNMGMTHEDALERTKEFGKDPYGKKTKNAPKEIRKSKGFIDRMTLSEVERQKMIEIILKKRNSNKDIVKKGTYNVSDSDFKISKILEKNIATIKKMAEKEGLTINQLVSLIKSE
jgi:hypothetical protein